MEKLKYRIPRNEKKYTTIYRREKRHNTLSYFLMWNKGWMKGRDIDEEQLFNGNDYYYLRKNRIA